MKKFWQRWLDRLYAPADTRVLALVRIFLALSVLGDLLRVAQLGMVDDLFVPYSAGGIGGIDEAPFLLDNLVGPTLAGPLAMWVTVVAMVFVALGIGVRPALVVGVIAYSQLGHCFPPGDRGIDRILRVVMILLLFSDSHKAYALGAKARLSTTTAWARESLVWLLVLIYFSAGMGKLTATPEWFGLSGTPVLYRILCDPFAAWLDPVFWADYLWLFRIGDWATMLVELSPVVLLWHRARPYWALFAVFIHIGIALTMKLGMFSFGMMAMYPVLFAAWLIPALDQIEARLKQS